MSAATLVQNIQAEGNNDAIVAAVNSDWKVLTALSKSLATCVAKAGKKDAPVAEAAARALTHMAENAMAVCEPYLITCLPALLANGAAKVAPVRAASKEAAAAICSNMSANAVMEVLPMLFNASNVREKWQVRELALQLITALGDSAPEQLGCALPQVVPEVTVSVTDTKKQVAAAATAAMTAACDVIGNRDIEHMTSHILRAITHPDDIQEIVHTLAGDTSAQSVSSGCLAMVVPLLLRGLRCRNTATRRQSALIIDNMSKLVDDPADAAPLLPLLLPGLDACSQATSEPEARSVVDRALDRMRSLEAEVNNMQLKEISHEAVLAALNAKLPKAVLGSGAVALSHVAWLACSMMQLKNFEVPAWSEVEAQLSQVVPAATARAAVAALVPECTDTGKVVLAQDDDDDDAEELCNCQFTLAYGSKILLHNTNMRLKRGAKYGLLGSNDSGKTTLMRAISNGSVEGFPDASTVSIVFVVADILGELSHLSCIDYIMQDERMSALSRKEVTATLNSVGFTATGKAKPDEPVSSLSGGWRMKLALARAMLQKADILLLDEPTNHLVVINVAWVKNYINSLTNVTCIMVSHHGSGFLSCGGSLSAAVHPCAIGQTECMSVERQRRGGLRCPAQHTASSCAAVAR